MRHNKVYSIHSQDKSKPHRIGDEEDNSVQPSTSSKGAEPPAPAPKPEPTPKPDGQAAAIALARAKISAAFGDQIIPEQNQAPVIAEGYAREQELQTIVTPETPPTQPDHELPSGDPKFDKKNMSPTEYSNHYETFNLPEPVKPVKAAQQQAPPPKTHVPIPEKKVPKTVKPKAKDKSENFKELRKKIIEKKSVSDTTEYGKKPWFKRLAPVAAAVTLLILIINNQLVYGQISYYVTPGDRVETPTIVEANIENSAPKGSRVLIPKINVDVPVNYSVDSYDEDAIQAGLEDGVVHYNKTGLPGEVGNNVILGHNTNNFWNSGRYKTAFVLLDRLEKEDTFELHYNEKRYIYEIYEKKVIEPDDFSVVTQEVTEPIVTLITCHPPGTSWKRLIIQARQISPEPTRVENAQKNELPDAVEGNIPANSESALESIFGWLF